MYLENLQKKCIQINLTTVMISYTSKKSIPPNSNNSKSG